MGDAGPIAAWSEALGRWAIPDAFLAKATDDPWAVGGALYRERAHAAAGAAREPRAVADRSPVLEVLRALGLDPSVIAWERASEPASLEAAGSRARRNLCLAPDREAAVAEAIARLVASGDLVSSPTLARRVVATIWWNTATG